MIVIGADTHKRSHTVAAVSEATGRVIGDVTVKAKRRSFDELLVWARGLGGERVWAIEDCRHVSGALERFLLARGERVVRVPPKLMAGARSSARERGKSDRIDAVAIARAAIREGLDTLPVAQLAGRELDQAVRIGPPPAARSYLVLEETPAPGLAGELALQRVDRSGQPGYGFLSERADRTHGPAGRPTRSSSPGLGMKPAPGSSALMRNSSAQPRGDKARAREAARDAGVPMPPFYDSLLGKLIVWGDDRATALARARRALVELDVAGVQTTAPLLGKLLDEEWFQAGDFHTATLETWLEADGIGGQRRMSTAGATSARYSWGGDEHLFVELAEAMSLEAYFRATAVGKALRDRRPDGVIDICPANASYDELRAEAETCRMRIRQRPITFDLAEFTADPDGYNARLLEVLRAD